MKLKVLHEDIFSTPLWSGMIPEIDNSPILDYCLKVRQEKPGVQVSNRGGWHSRDIIYPIPDILLELFEGLTNFANNVCGPKIGVTDLVFGNFWININGQYDYNTLHDHQKSILSGTYYVSVPDNNMGDIVFSRDDTSAYFLHSGIKKEYNYYNAQNVNKQVSEGSFILFPSWTKHQVERNESSKERISIAFNFIQAND